MTDQPICEGARVGTRWLTGRSRHRTAGRLAATAGVVAAAAGLVLIVPEPGWAAEAGIESVKAFATKLTNYVTAVAASVAVLFMAISGVRWTMSSGNPMRQTEARNGLVAAASGLAIALSANLIVTLVVAALK